MRTKSPEQAEKILKVAAQLFASQRFHEARMEDIAAAAEVGKGTLYRYFKDKEDLYLALLDKAARGLRQHINAGQAEAVDPVAKLEAMVGSILEFFDANPYLLDLLQHAEGRQQTGTLANWQEVRSANVKQMTAILDEGRRAGLWDVPDPEIPVLVLLGGLRAVLRFSPPPRPPNLAKRIVRDFLNGADRSETFAVPGAMSG